ncbi:MAG TPA: histidinol dehydrogenase, partial [Phnomibacter sp.]|nr:histidinol dehydrogenase [Phnomibacter sp.]
AAQLAGVTCLAKVGGAQAIAAMAYGTESVPAVYKIFGPGNQYVTAAKQLVQQQGVAIDMPAGPSEVCVMADETANPAFVAADLLSQAEHGADSQVLLVATPSFNLQALYDQLAAQLEALPRQHFAAAALANSKALIMDNLEQAIDLVNHYAPEHLIVAMQQCHTVAERITNAGSVFLGNFTPESVGDYASGTNHTLPTNGHARVYAGVSLDSFTKKMTVQELTPEGLNNIAQTVITMAMAEGLEAHARAVEVRKVKSEKGGVKSEE